MADDSSPERALSTTTGGDRAASINPRLRAAAQQALSADEYVHGIRDGDRAVLSRAITLLESTRPAHRETAQEVLERCLPHAGDVLRVGITGVPGVGKSTFIETLGTQLTGAGRRLAVLAIDPTSTRTGGSILGDKTRMEQLAACDSAYVRPSPTAGTLGGVARTTRETILLCEAAGFDLIFVETVGVGQAEITVHSMVDCFLLLALAGAGDALQGIKRGIVEMADVLVVTKADGANREAADMARAELEQALRLFPAGESGWTPPVLTCSALTGDGIDAVWESVRRFEDQARTSGHFEENRRRQARHWMRQTIEHRLRDDFYQHPAVQAQLDDVETAVRDGSISSFAAAEKLLSAYQGSSTKKRDAENHG